MLSVFQQWFLIDFSVNSSYSIQPHFSVCFGSFHQIMNSFVKYHKERLFNLEIVSSLYTFYRTIDAEILEIISIFS